MTKEIVIVSAVRTAIGSFNGSLKNVDAVELGSTAIKGALEQAGVKAEQVDEVIMGNGLEANQDFTKYKIFNIKGTFSIKENQESGTKNRDKSQS